MIISVEALIPDRIEIETQQNNEQTKVQAHNPTHSQEALIQTNLYRKVLPLSINMSSDEYIMPHAEPVETAEGAADAGEYHNIDR